MLKILILPSGTIQMMHDDDFISLYEEGEVDITRASHVEPFGKGLWEADLAPAGGPVLSGFETRGEALKAEVEWINRNVLS